MKRFALFSVLTCLLGTIQLEAQDNWLSKKYYAYHTHNSYELRFNRKGQYTQVTNDRKDSKLKGRYELLGDTVVLYRTYFHNGMEQEQREYYIRHEDDCIVLMPWRYGYYNSLDAPLGEKQLDINYPQISMKDAPKMEVEKMVQVVIDSIQPRSAYDSTLHIKPYYEVNPDNGYRFNIFGSQMSFINEKDSVSNYLEIKTIGLGIENAVVILEIQPRSEARQHLVATFKKINGSWLVDGRIN